MAAAHAGFQGLVFFRQRLGSFLLGALLLVGAFAWFFLSESRNVPDTAHGMNGNEQFAYFFAGAGAGLAFTLLASSLRNWALGAGPTGGGPPPPGLEALRQSNYLRTLSRSLRKLRLRPHRRTGSETSRLVRGCSTKAAHDLPGQEREEGLPS